ncbi:MAG: hypothetical protein GXO50_02535 [Chlorobi bacterium]|nr:hypothetical protein [Chlorobiota bacterium]
MPSKIKVIDRNRILGGYTLSVRDDWVYKVKKVHINETEKEEYIKKFGDEEMITFNTFFEWYKKLKTEKKDTDYEKNRAE